MRDLLDYPLAAFRSAFRTILGWTAVMAVTTFGGFAVANAALWAAIATWAPFWLFWPPRG